MNLTSDMYTMYMYIVHVQVLQMGNYKMFLHCLNGIYNGWIYANNHLITHL